MIIRLFIGNPTASFRLRQTLCKEQRGPPLNSDRIYIYIYLFFLLTFFYLLALFLLLLLLLPLKEQKKKKKTSSDRFIKRLLVLREREPVYIDDYIYERGVYI